VSTHNPASKTRAAQGLGPADEVLREVIDGGRTIVARDGFAGLTMRRLCEVAGFTTGTLMHHFPDKRSVVAAFVDGFTTEWIERVGRTLDRAEASAAPHAGLTAITALSIPPPGRGREEWPVWMEMWMKSNREPVIAEILQRASHLWEALLEAGLDQSVSRGVLSPTIDAARESKLLGPLIDGVGLWAWRSDEWDAGLEHLLWHFSHLGLGRDVADRIREEHVGEALIVWS
jgi:AcrR family transcriptional regulator